MGIDYKINEEGDWACALHWAVMWWFPPQGVPKGILPAGIRMHRLRVMTNHRWIIGVISLPYGQDGACDRAILICSTGIGVSMAVTRSGASGAHCHNLFPFISQGMQ